MVYRITAAILGVLLVLGLAVLGIAIYRDFMIWSDQQWGMGKIEQVVHSKIRKVIKKNSLSGRTYFVSFNGGRRKVTIIESIAFEQGDSMRVVYSAKNPKYFKPKVPSIAWITGWALAFLFFTPLVLYYGLQVLWGYVRGRY